MPPLRPSSRRRGRARSQTSRRDSSPRRSPRDARRPRRACAHVGTGGLRSSTIAIDGPLRGGMDHGEDGTASASRTDHEPPGGIGGIRLCMTRTAERDQPVEVEVRTALGALEDVVDLQTRPRPARLTPPPGAGQDRCADGGPLLMAGRGPAARARAASADPPPCGHSHRGSAFQAASSPHREAWGFCPCGQTGALGEARRFCPRGQTVA